MSEDARDREQRLKAALRQNLQKRKAQARSRAVARKADDGEAKNADRKT